MRLMSFSAPSEALPPPVPLSARLKGATRELHAAAERSGVMLALLRGRIEWPAYLSLLRNLRALYAALEAGLDQLPAGAAGTGLWRPELRRLPALDQDLAHWHAVAASPEASPLPPLVPATQAYTTRLQALAAEAPGLLPAHAYVRYLGDLYGGQVLSRLVRQQFNLPEGPGTSFYEFGEAGQVEQLRADFRSALDALPLTAPQAAAFIEEACQGFRLHGQMFEQIQGQSVA